MIGLSQTSICSTALRGCDAAVIGRPLRWPRARFGAAIGGACTTTRYPRRHAPRPSERDHHGAQFAHVEERGAVRSRQHPVVAQQRAATDPHAAPQQDVTDPCAAHDLAADDATGGALRGLQVVVPPAPAVRTAQGRRQDHGRQRHARRVAPHCILPSPAPAVGCALWVGGRGSRVLVARREEKSAARLVPERRLGAPRASLRRLLAHLERSRNVT